MPENPLHLLMNPCLIAVVGASNDFSKMGTIQALSIIRDGYQGMFYPVRVKEKTFWGILPFRWRPICRKFLIWLFTVYLSSKRREALTKKETVNAAEGVQYPAALMACRWDMPHKSGKGLIVLNIENAAGSK